MKILTKEEEAQHYKAVVTGGAIGGAVGLGLGFGGVMWASRRYPAFKSLTLPFKTFLVSSTSTFCAIINADRWSMDFEKRQNPMSFYKTEEQRLLAEAHERMRADEKALHWAREHRYTIVFSSWLAGMGVALSMVGRSKYLTAAQKIVQARVYAQGLTLAVLIATAALEMGDAKSGRGRWETVLVLDPNDPEHKHLIEKKIHKEEYYGQDLWKDMVAAEERRLEATKKAKEAAAAVKQRA